MASLSLLRASTRPEYICARCTFRASKTASRTTRRWITMKYLSKLADAELAWFERAARVRSGEEQSMLTILEERGLVQTITGQRKTVDRMMTDRRLGAYVGIDPTASSLHVGHMIPLMSLFWMYVNGYHTVSLLGGATAKIGDPTDRLTSRTKEHASIRTANMASMHLQLKLLWKNVETYGKKYGYHWEWAWHRELINNNAWWNSLPMLQVLQLLGPGMRLGSMLARDTVKNKMSKGDGMSFAEFTYPLMQAWDWWYMFHTKGIQMQIGGSDQFGNITAGMDAVNYIITHHPDPVVRKEAAAVGEPFGFTVPLLTTSSGQKFGKSAGNAIWLDIEQTSSFELYKYFLGTADADAEKYLKMFTFMPLKDIQTLVEEHMKSPELRKAQHKLASEFVEIIHGAEEASFAEQHHRLLFKNPNAVLFGYPEDGQDGQDQTEQMVLSGRPKVHLKVPRSIIYQRSTPKILAAIGLTRTTSEGHRLIAGGGAYIGVPEGKIKNDIMKDGSLTWSKIQNSWEPDKIRNFHTYDDLLLFRRSKDKIRVVQVVSDEQYALSGETYTGMTRQWRIGVLKAIEVKASITRAEKENIAKLLADDESFLRESEEDAPAKKAPKKVDESKAHFVKTTKMAKVANPASSVDESKVHFVMTSKSAKVANPAGSFDKQ